MCPSWGHIPVLSSRESIHFKPNRRTSWNFEWILQILIEEFRKKLSGWKPWGPAVLNMYLSGQKKAVANYLIEQYGLNESAAYRQRKAFEIFSSGTKYR